jgi:hypothetical protein
MVGSDVKSSIYCAKRYKNGVDNYENQNQHLSSFHEVFSSLAAMFANTSREANFSIERAIIP